MLLTFMPPGAFFGYWFVGTVLRGCLSAQGLTPLGYGIMLYPGVTSAACLGTLALRFCGKPSAWLAWTSVALVGAFPFLGFIAMLVVMALVIPVWGWAVIFVTVGTPIVVLWLVDLRDGAASTIA
jgi:hypothetical protein